MDRDESLSASFTDIDNSRNSEVVMKSLLTIALILTGLYACGGELNRQDEASADKSLPTEQSTIRHTDSDEYGANVQSNAEADNVSTENSISEDKTNSHIRMVMGLAQSMY